MQNIDMIFPVRGTLPVDHGYPLFSAISRLVPSAHGSEGWALLPVRGKLSEDKRLLATTPDSSITIRLAKERAMEFLPLMRQAMTVDGYHLDTADFHVRSHRPAAALVAHNVSINVIEYQNDDTDDVRREKFTASLMRQLRQIAEKDQFNVDDLVVTVGRTRMQRIGKMQTLKRKAGEVEDRARVLGYQVFVEDLTPEASLSLQHHGLGGHRHMGCGSFIPTGRTR